MSSSLETSKIDVCPDMKLRFVSLNLQAKCFSVVELMLCGLYC